MKIVRGIDFLEGSREEQLPNFESNFPYIASRAELNQYAEGIVPWHWHKAVEVFYIERGNLEYSTPNGYYIFPQGSGGMVNSNVLHTTKPQDNTVQLLHIFDPSLIGGETENRIVQKYIMPIITSGELDMIPLYPDNLEQKEVLDLIKNAFNLSEQEFGYELKLRERLTEIWLSLFKMSFSVIEKKKTNTRANDRIKLMMVYVHENFADKITVSDLAKVGYISERDCFRVFQECLHMTPIEYITNYRLQKACYMLVHSKDTISAISQECGLGSSSFFGKTFREHIGMTPMEYRKKWRNSDI